MFNLFYVISHNYMLRFINEFVYYVNDYYLYYIFLNKVTQKAIGAKIRVWIVCDFDKERNLELFLLITLKNRYREVK